MNFVSKKPISTVILEGFIVGISLIFLVTFVDYLISLIHPFKFNLFQQLINFEFHYLLVFFITGLLFHLIFEYTGLNLWYSLEYCKLN